MKSEVCRPIQGLIATLLLLILCVVITDFGVKKVQVIGESRQPSSVAECQNPEAESDALTGRLVQWSPKLRLSCHAEILAYGLEDPRGLAYDAAGHRIMIADGSRGKLISYSIKSGRLEQPAGNQPYEYCSQGPCEEIDSRGIAIWNGNLYVAEHGLNRIAARAIFSDEHDQDYERNFPEQLSQLNGPSAITFSRDGDAAFVTDDRPWPGSAGQQTAYDSADYAHWLAHDTPRLFGSVYRIKLEEEEGMKAELIDATLPHPSGLAVSPDGMTLYITTCDGHQTQWVIFRKANLETNEWHRNGVLASEKLINGTIPPYQGILVDESGQTIYAAGPGGLHIFDSTGAGLGRMEFEGRVTGLTSHKNHLYLAVGHTLCRLKL